MGRIFNIVRHILPFGCVIFILILFQQKKTQTAEINNLKAVVLQQSQLLEFQAKNIVKLHEMGEFNAELLAKVQNFTGIYEEERERLRHEIKEGIAHEECRDIKLPDHIAKRMREFATGKLDN
ncbi:hypothetical protein [Aeromonas sp. SG16]|uniref:hypothetical protein n=1 Tax=Aeromonas sp. SG16 TaxID=2950548 RepID=UPI002109FA8C|nr:hypothetical protein [Aeromonas sp. SG16]MCQ4054454.1 hypothetical protein [Aeromonas sp. SG16]